MPQTYPISRLLSTIGRWWRSIVGGATGERRSLFHQQPEDDVATMLSLPPDSRAFEEFLYQLGVKMESTPVQETSTITILQQSRHHDGFYRVDLVRGCPHLLILIPTEHLLTFRGYLVCFHESHPLSSTLNHLASYQGSRAFEQERSIIEEHLLAAIAEALKGLFWAGFATGQFPPEIRVRRLAITDEARDDTEA